MAMTLLWLVLPLAVEVVAVAGLAHMIYLYREKNLPCKDCEKRVETNGYTVV